MKSVKKKTLPAWYKLYIENRINKLEIALSCLDNADIYINSGYTVFSMYWLGIAKRTIK